MNSPTNDFAHILMGLETLYDIDFVVCLRKAIQRFPEVIKSDFLSRDQIKSKLWARDCIYRAFGENLGTVFILGGWFGLMARILLDDLRFKKLTVRSFDIDPLCEKVADRINRPYVIDDWKFKASTYNMYDLNYDHSCFEVHYDSGETTTIEETPDLIINTCCEHLEHFDSWYKKIPKGKKLVLQSNNFYAGKEHVNCSDSLDKFMKTAPMSLVKHAETLPLEKYDRYILVGVR